MLFSKRLTPAPPLALCLEATIQGRSPGFQAELIPVRSPLLRESYLVSFPPLTYMLKFSGFADLTSCCAKGCHLTDDIFKERRVTRATKCPKNMLQVTNVCALSRSVCATNPTQESRAMAHKDTNTHKACLQEDSTSTEAGILPGITRECNARSRIHWFTEFCNSQ